ncbi:hypothetical protein LP419_03995 [Massilia sp. H-1]|nr:hypothetical protein LP419_03995 [Massilia sp. H-1]
MLFSRQPSDGHFHEKFALMNYCDAQASGRAFDCDSHFCAVFQVLDLFFQFDDSHACDEAQAILVIGLSFCALATSIDAFTLSSASNTVAIILFSARALSKEACNSATWVSQLAKFVRLNVHFMPAAPCLLHDLVDLGRQHHSRLQERLDLPTQHVVFGTHFGQLLVDTS